VEQYEINWKNYYKILGVSPDAEAEVVNAAYKALCKKYHPDMGAADAQRMKEINEAYEHLSNSQKKAVYDQYYHQKQTRTKATPPHKSSCVNPPEPSINPPYVNVGSLKIPEKRMLVFSARNLGGPATDVAVEYSPDVSWLNISTSATTLPFRITVEVDTSSLTPHHLYQVQISLILDGVVATAVLQFETISVSAQQQATNTKASTSGTGTAPTKSPVQLNKVFPWPGWGWQRAALFAGFPVGLYLLAQLDSPLVWIGIALLALTCYGGFATRWLRNTSQASPVAKGAAGTSIALTMGGSLVAAAMAALFVALFIAAIVLVFIIIFGALSSKG